MEHLPTNRKQQKHNCQYKNVREDPFHIAIIYFILWIFMGLERRRKKEEDKEYTSCSWKVLTIISLDLK